MQPMSTDALNRLLVEAGIDMAAQDRGIGRHLAYEPPAKRTFVIQLAEDNLDEDALTALRCMLRASDEWLLLERYASHTSSDCAAERFTGDEYDTLLTRLGSVESVRPDGIGVGDIYLLSGDGKALVTWDHHTWSEGLSIQFNEVGKSAAVLASLNEAGTEMDIHYTP